VNEDLQTPEQEEAESLRRVVQQELEAMLPFTAKLRRAIGQLGELSVLLGRTIARAVKPPFSFSAVAYQVEVLGVRSLSIGSLTAVFAGLVMSLQFAFFMARFGVQHTVGKVVSLSIFRELGPVLTALTVGARIGSGIAAELGSMKATEQIDAIRALGADPIRKLALPRLLACVVVMPSLTVLADILALVAGSAVVKVEYEIPFEQFYRSAVETAKLGDFFSGIVKSAIFGLIIAAVGCYKGFQVEGGTEGVGRATTETVAIAAVAVLLADFFVTKLFLAF
jgi:phospholipid/cholesterol/gamma-HCH transport system permease protein